MCSRKDDELVCTMFLLYWKIVEKLKNYLGLDKNPNVNKLSKKVKVLPTPMAHRETPISVSVALGHTSVNGVKATAGGWSTFSSACLIFPLHSLMLSARQEGSEYHF